MPKRNAPEFTWIERIQSYRKRIQDPYTGKWVDVYGKTKTELREKVAIRQAAFDEEARKQDSPYVYEYAAKWFDLNTGSLSESRKDDYRNAINNYICPVIGGKLLQDVKQDDVLEVLAESKKKAPSKSSQQKILTALKRIFAAAEANGYIDRSPCTGLTASGTPAKEKAPLTEDQCRILLEAIRGTRAYLFVMIGLYAGLRREEIAGLQWDCIHLDADPPYIDVRRAVRWEKNNRPVLTDKLKSEKAYRKIPIAPQLLPALAEAKAASCSLFVVPDSKGEVMSYTSLQNLWGIIESRSTGHTRRKGRDGKIYERDKQLGEKVGRHNLVITIDFPVTPHQLRHTFITRLILSGANIKTVQYLAGHATVALTLDIYTHLMQNRPGDTLGAITQAFEELEQDGKTASAPS